MRGLKQRTTPLDEFVATCSICGAALRPVHMLRGTSGTRCSFCGSPLVSTDPEGRTRRPPAPDEESPLGLLTEFDRPRRVRPALAATISVLILVAIAAAAFLRERGRDDGLAATPDRPTTSVAGEPRGEPSPADQPRTFDHVRVAVQVTDTTWIETRKDGELAASETYPAGEDLTFRADDEITLRFYDGGGLRIRAGGREITTKEEGGVVEVRLWLDDGRIRAQRSYL